MGEVPCSGVLVETNTRRSRASGDTYVGERRHVQYYSDQRNLDVSRLRQPAVPETGTWRPRSGSSACAAVAVTTLIDPSSIGAFSPIDGLATHQVQFQQTADQIKTRQN